MKYLLFGLLCLLATSMISQVNGRIIDNTGTPLIYANVVLIAANDSSFVAGQSAGEDGTFSFQSIENGRFFVVISSLGYSDFSSNVFELTDAKNMFDLGAITLAFQSNDLEGVVVSAQKDLIQYTATGRVINVGSSLMTLGSSALQVLERVPGVVLDRRNSQFSLNGQTGVGIAINGRQVRMAMEDLINLLESTAAGNIEKMEMITSPTAGFDADGGGGIINIVMKKNYYRETKINFSTTAGYGFRAKENVALGISKNYEKVNIFGSYSFSHNSGRAGFSGYGTSYMPIIGGKSNGTFSNIADRKQNAHNINLNAEFAISSQALMGIDISTSISNNVDLNHIDNVWDVESKDYIRMQATSRGLNKRNYIISSLYLKRDFSKHSSLDLDASYISYRNRSPTKISAEYFDRSGMEYHPPNEEFTSGNLGESFSTIGIGVFKADYCQKINQYLDAKFGVKGSYSNNDNDSNVKREHNGIWETDPRSQSKITGEEKVYAAYSEFEMKIGQRSSMHAGLRYEYWGRRLNLYNENFKIGKLFPSLLFRHNVSERSIFTLGYHRRIDRPAYVDLISNLFYNDPTAIFTGNPLLKPGISEVLKTSMTLKGFNFDLRWQKDLNSIIRYQLTANEAMDILIVSPQNIDFQRSINLSISGPIQILSGWRMILGSTTALRKYKISYSVVPAVKSYVYQNINFSQDFELPKDFSLELSGWYNFPFYDGTNKLKGFGVVNLGIGKKLRDDRGTIQLALPDLFQTFRVFTDIGGMTSIVYDIDTVSTWKDESARYRVFNFTYSRTFGENGHKRKHDSDSDERDRIL